VALVGLLFSLSACTDNAARAGNPPADVPNVDSGPRVYGRYGSAVRVGEGFARAYVLYDRQAGGVPVEVGVALDERAMDGLPAPNPNLHAMPASSHEHLDNHVYMLSLPGDGAPPFNFIELDWNPGGHEPPGIYDEPHFDFHFYLVPPAEREAIVPSDPEFQRKADMLPPEAQRAPFYAMAAPPGAPAPAVPLMGVHWIDVRSPELQKMFGKPEAWRPFTTTFIYGSWEGRFHFLEPMITRSYIMSKKGASNPEVRDEIIAIPTLGEVGAPGYYPDSYRIAWDADAKLSRIALTNLERRD
jgi:hypothetical protein